MSRHYHHVELSVGETARFLGVHTQTVRNWCDFEKIKCSRIEEGPRRIPPTEVIEVLRRNKMPIPPDLMERAKAAELAHAA